MTKFSKFMLILSIFALATSCGKKEEVVENDTHVVEVEQEKPVKNELNINAISFSSKVVIDNIKNSSNISYIIASNPNYTKIEQGDFDIAVVPGYLGPYFYEKTNKNIEIAAITLLDNIHIVSDEEIKSQSDLQGKNLLIPDPVGNLSKVIDKKIGPLNLVLRLKEKYYKNMNDIVDKMSKTSNFLTVLIDPYFSKVIDKDYYISDLSSILPIDKGEFVSDIIIVNKDYLKDNKEEFDTFLKDYKESTQAIEETSDFDINISNEILNEYDITEQRAQMALKRSNPVFIDGDTMKGTYKVFLEKIKELDESLVGENEPTDDLYYEK
ncbi:hypothetical protein JNO63_06830 [Anaerococcus sp. mt242]|uniref:hypothetical protein n=1 Tax=Anaerococcus sp. mt242 TaxID=2661917 RepID=UPI00193243D6|nr:hypothetical protein [Anaerococcus sp. mt242]MBM0046803.1 hypothetical protein [Anaerococcus sp. mt242]